MLLPPDSKNNTYRLLSGKNVPIKNLGLSFVQKGYQMKPVNVLTINGFLKICNMSDEALLTNFPFSLQKHSPLKDEKESNGVYTPFLESKVDGQTLFTLILKDLLVNNQQLKSEFIFSLNESEIEKYKNQIATACNDLKVDLLAIIPKSLAILMKNITVVLPNNKSLFTVITSDTDCTRLDLFKIITHSDEKQNKKLDKPIIKLLHSENVLMFCDKALNQIYKEMTEEVVHQGFKDLLKQLDLPENFDLISFPFEKPLKEYFFNYKELEKQVIEQHSAYIKWKEQNKDNQAVSEEDRNKQRMFNILDIPIMDKENSKKLALVGTIMDLEHLDQKIQKFLEKAQEHSLKAEMNFLSKAVEFMNDPSINLGNITSYLSILNIGQHLQTHQTVLFNYFRFNASSTDKNWPRGGNALPLYEIQDDRAIIFSDPPLDQKRIKNHQKENKLIQENQKDEKNQSAQENQKDEKNQSAQENQKDEKNQSTKENQKDEDEKSPIYLNLKDFPSNYAFKSIDNEIEKRNEVILFASIFKNCPAPNDVKWKEYSELLQIKNNIEYGQILKLTDIKRFIDNFASFKYSYENSPKSLANFRTTLRICQGEMKTNEELAKKLQDHYDEVKKWYDEEVTDQATVETLEFSKFDEINRKNLSLKTEMQAMKKLVEFEKQMALERKQKEEERIKKEKLEQEKKEKEKLKQDATIVEHKDETKLENKEEKHIDEPIEKTKSIKTDAEPLVSGDELHKDKKDADISRVQEELSKDAQEQSDKKGAFSQFFDFFKNKAEELLPKTVRELSDVQFVEKMTNLLEKTSKKALPELEKTFDKASKPSEDSESHAKFSNLHSRVAHSLKNVPDSSIARGQKYTNLKNEYNALTGEMIGEEEKEEL
ncbi:hypothetical protein M153_100031975 [Pseudoloma neurophilia]|uniref:Uncharacterized protein n=1 Tax=Pseudoloma neurophilia TaxID=146866 RepID=A0A0R0M7C6_9MICR|nr:hypothetical protein M153_100031975 [Pseudoloma neurophilia]